MRVWVTQVEAWAPGLDGPEAWRAFDPASLPVGDDKPPAPAVPAMTRRRLTRWGRQALQVADPASRQLRADAPVIFSSRHGDTARTLKLLRNLAGGEPLSPNAFSLSVHNSALGLYTILYEHRAPSLALAAGRDTLAAAWLEAQCWLADGSEQVLLVHTEEPLEDFYRPYADEREMPAAVAFQLVAEPRPGAVPVQLSMAPAGQTPAEDSMMIRFLHWWYGAAEGFTYHSDQHSWSWRRDLAP